MAKTNIRVGDCVMTPMERGHGTGKVVGRERDLLHVKFFGLLRPMRLKNYEVQKAACPSWLAGKRRRTRRKKR